MFAQIVMACVFAHVVISCSGYARDHGYSLPDMVCLVLAGYLGISMNWGILAYYFPQAFAF